jgi:AraC-like DNA-binding protein
MRLVGVMVREDRVSRIFGDDIPKAIRPLLRSEGETSAMLEVPVDARYRKLAATLFSSPLNGSLRSIYIEGTVLQLLATQVAHAKSGSLTDGLSQRERAAVRAAHEHLIANMRHPPGSGVLAAEVGISEAKLTAGFRALYGGSVYEVLRDERLEHARIALETTSLPVKEIAFRIGYNHFTNFIAAFTARYGISPGRYARRRGAPADEASVDERRAFRANVGGMPDS